jgi:hypothetical protein
MGGFVKHEHRCQEEQQVYQQETENRMNDHGR